MDDAILQPEKSSEAWYPKVLMISRREVTELDTSGISRGRWFQAWPKDRIAQVYSSSGQIDPPFCPTRYMFGPKDRLFGQLFARLKSSSWGTAFREQRVPVDHTKTISGTVRKSKTKLVEWVVENGLWEMIFATRISGQLLESCRAFRPDVLYSICTDLSHTELTLQLADALQIPLCIQVEDDWFAALYASGIGRLLLRKRVKRAVQTLINVSNTHLSNGPMMSEAYLRDYGCWFDPVYLSDDIARFDQITEKAADPLRARTIVYSGSLGHDRTDGIIDLDDALNLLPPEMGSFRIAVFASHVPADAAERLNSRPRIELNAGLADENVPLALREADLVFLPESFRPKWRTHIHYSISSKSHLYMMSGRPAIVYGPPGIGVVEYARTDRWAELVDERNPARLANALATLLSDRSKGMDLVGRARAVALRNHDAGRVREQVRQLLVRCAKGKVCRRG